MNDISVVGNTSLVNVLMLPSSSLSVFECLITSRNNSKKKFYNLGSESSQNGMLNCVFVFIQYNKGRTWPSGRASVMSGGCLSNDPY